MSRKERCPECFKAVVGLYINISKPPTRKYTRKAYYCKHCNLVLKDNEICFKVVSYKLKEYIPKSKRE